MAKSNNSIRLSEALDLYLNRQAARQKSQNTIDSDWQAIRMFIRVVGDLRLSNLTPQHVERFFYGEGGLMGEHASGSNGVQHRPPVSPSTHNHYRSRLRCFFTWCYEQGYIRQDNLFQHVSPLKVRRRNRLRPSPTNLLALLDAAVNPRDRAFIATILNTALRSNEVVRYRISDVYLEDGFLDTVISKTGVEDEQPITADLDLELRVWLTHYAETLGRDLRPDDYLFPGLTGGEIVGYDDDRQIIRKARGYDPRKPVREPYKVVQKALAALGLPTKGEGTHTLRRAVARHYFDAVAQDKGDVAALRETAALLHHQNIATTEGYLGTTPERENRDRRLRGKPFLSAMIDRDNVVPLRPAATGE